MPKPLEGMRVLDLTQFYSGPWATLLLAGLWAEVIKVNHPATGDVVAMGPPYAGSKGVSFHRQSEDDLGIAYLKRTRNKKSLTLNLKEPRGLDLFYRLVDEADVLVENFSVGVTERLKIDYETLEKRKPRLIYCSITSYGQSGPDARLKGYDAVTQAVSGLMNLTGFPDGPPTKAGSAIADSIGGTFAFGAITTALLHRERTGQGQWIDVSMVDCLLSLVFDEPMDCYEALGLPERLGNRIMRLSPFNAYQAEDGWLVIGSGTDAHWNNILRAVGREELVGDARYADLSGRITHNDEVDAVITEWTEKHTVEDALSTLRRFDVICGPVHTIEDILAWPHLKARNMLEDLPHPALGPLSGVKTAGFPLKFSKSPGGYDAPAPLNGQHNEEILGERLGLTKEEIEKLKRDGVI